MSSILAIGLDFDGGWAGLSTWIIEDWIWIICFVSLFGGNISSNWNTILTVGSCGNTGSSIDASI